MASVFRVKRRRNEDPAEALRLSCKRKCLSPLSVSSGVLNKHEPGTQDSNDSLLSSNDSTPLMDKDGINTKHSTSETEVQEIESILSFAGTISTKDEPISHHIKAAIKKTKLHKEMHPHSNEYRHGNRDILTSRKRERVSEASRASRYRVTSSRRAIDLTLLDKQTEEHNTNLRCIGNTVTPTDISNSDKTDDCIKQPASPQAISLSSSVGSSATVSENCDSVIKSDKMFCVFDIENEEEDTLASVSKTSDSLSGITMNNIPMISSKNVLTAAPLAESEYVYDLYYTHTDVNNIDLQAVLTVKSLCEEFVNEEDDIDRDFVHEDEDDSNDEGNWRNDYPDEDPHFFENDDDLADVYYADDMNYRDVVDDGDILSEWLGASCKVVDSDDGEAEYDKNSDDSSDESSY